ncbi:MAG TPA: DUF2092 domain-containing protein [Gemmatimonadaceae bacterium]
MDGVPCTNAISRYASQAAMVAACLTLAASKSTAQAASNSKSAVDTGTVKALRKMGAYLRGLQHFGVSGQTMRDLVLNDGQKVEIEGTLNYVVRAPDRFRGQINTDRKQRQIIYDGKTLTVYAPRMHYYATVPAPSTISATIDTARVRYGIDFPIADLFLWGTPRDGVKDLTSAQYIGPSHVGGNETDQYALRQRGVDWQLWIARGAMPVPVKLVITTTSEPSEPRYAATLEWDLSPAVGDAVFAFVPPRDASRITLASYGAALEKERQPARR